MSQQSGIHIHRWWAKAHFVWRQRQVSNRVIWHSVVVQCSVFTAVMFTMLFTTGTIFDEIFLWQVFWAAPHKVQIVPGLSQRTILALQNIPKYPSWTPLDLHNIDSATDIKQRPIFFLLFSFDQLLLPNSPFKRDVSATSLLTVILSNRNSLTASH